MESPRDIFKKLVLSQERKSRSSNQLQKSLLEKEVNDKSKDDTASDSGSIYAEVVPKGR